MKRDNFEKIFSSLEGFSKTPPEDLWKGIEEKLDRSKKKRQFAFWWPIAASLVVGLGLLAIFYFQTNQQHSLIDKSITPNNGVVNQSGSINEVEEKNENNVPIAIGKQKNQSEENQNGKNQNQTEEKIVNTVTGNSSTGNKILKVQNQSIATVAKNNSAVLNPSNNNQSVGLINSDKTFAKRQQHAIVEGKSTEKEITVSKENENSIKKDDLQENALTALANEQQKKEKKTPLEERWSLQVFAGVNSSQNVKNQKSLGNTIESQKGYNYGVKTNYKLNRRWAVSTGLKISELGQQVANVSYVNSAKSLVNKSQIPFASAPKEKGGITTNSNYLFISQNSDHTVNTLSSTFYETGNLSQKVQYLEMPMEVSYAILNKGKARVNLNTGGFVGKVISNEVLLNDSSIGENSDVNDVVIGTVLSSTLQYELYKKTKVFIEPGINYYSQPVQNQNFNQFQMIVNFGLNVSF